MPSLREHFESPQFPDMEELPEGDPDKPGFSIAKISGGWVAPGQPRWRAYLFYLLVLLGGVILAISSGPDGFDLLAFGGVVLAAFGLLGTAETWRGKPFPRLW